MLLMFVLDLVRTEAAMALGLAATCGLVSKQNPEQDDRAYYRLIDDALRYRANRKIPNRKPAHTVYLLTRFFSCARRNMRIYTGGLSRTVGKVRAYADPEVTRSAIEFLRRNDARLSIVIVGEPDVDPGQPIGSHPLLAAISEADGIRGTVRVSRGNPRDWRELPHHFVIMDSEAVRIEFDGNSADGAARFGDAHFAGRLARIFDEFERTGSLLFRLGAADDPTPRTERECR